MVKIKRLISRLFLIVLLLSIFGCSNTNISTVSDESSCKIDSDCVKATCCHANSCVSKEKATSCEGIMCTQECAPNTMDCGQGSCKCITGECMATFEGIEPIGGNTQIANPASVYCDEQGNELEIRSDSEGNQYGICVFPDGTKCEEWAYYRKECGQMCGGIAGIMCPEEYTCNMQGKTYPDASGFCVIKK